MLFPGSIVNARAGLGANVIINRGPVVEHDWVLEDHVHVGTRARLASGIRLGLGGFT
jgi:UDP-3-O-[3-hydroxymyristoyl] glucosamine N-acyltransferase